jgi:hypothetical protein
LDLRALVFQPYPLDPGSVQFLVEEALGISADAPVELVVQALSARGPAITSDERENLAQFVRRACSENDAIRRSFERTTRKLGRCPKGERGWLRRQLAPDEETKISGSFATERAFSPSVERLDLSELSGSISNFPAVIDRIAALDPAASELEIRLSDFTYASAIAVLAQWVLAHRFENRHSFLGTSPEMHRYLEAIRFSAVLRNREIVIKPDAMDWAIGLTRINRDLPTERVTEKIVDILDTFVNPPVADPRALYVLISEMIENVHRHAEVEVDGIAVAQVYPKKLKMGITLVDAGIGVRESFVRGDPSVSIDSTADDEVFLREAVRLHSTSKVRRHSGYGLYLLSELLRRNRGTFLLSSGTATLVGFERRKMLAFEAFRHRAWRGTIVSAIINLSNSLPLLDIYKEMPAPAGYSAEDLFVE